MREEYEEAVEQQPAEKITFLQIFCMLGGCVALVVLIVAALFYMTGVFTVFGRNITVITAADLILQIFNTNRAIIYRNIFGLILGALYYIQLILVIKCLCVAIVYTVKLLSRQKTMIKTVAGPQKKFLAETYLRRIARQCLCVFELFCIFMISSAAVAETGYDNVILYLFVAFGVVSILRTMARAIDRKAKAADIVLDSIRTVFLHVAICLMVFLMTEPCVEEFIAGCTTIFNGNLNTAGGYVRIGLYSIFSSIIAPVWVFVLDSMFLRLIDVYSSGENIAPIQRTFLISLILLMALSFIFKCVAVSVDGSVGIYTFTSWLTLIQNTFIPMLLISVMFLILSPVYGKDGRHF